MAVMVYSFVVDGSNRSRGPIGAIHYDDPVGEILREVDEMRHKKREKAKKMKKEPIMKEPTKKERLRMSRDLKVATSKWMKLEAKRLSEEKPGWQGTTIVCKQIVRYIKPDQSWQAFWRMVRLLNAVKENFPDLDSPCTVVVLGRDGLRITDLQFGGIPFEKTLRSHVPKRCRSTGLYRFEIGCELFSSYYLQDRYDPNRVVMFCSWPAAATEEEFRQFLNQHWPESARQRSKIIPIFGSVRTIAPTPNPTQPA